MKTYSMEELFGILADCLSSNEAARSSAETKIFDFLHTSPSNFFDIFGEIISNHEVELGKRNICLIILKNVLYSPNVKERVSAANRWLMVDDTIKERFISRLFLLLADQTPQYTKRIPQILGSLVRIDIRHGSKSTLVDAIYDCLSQDAYALNAIKSLIVAANQILKEVRFEHKPYDEKFYKCALFHLNSTNTELLAITFELFDYGAPIFRDIFTSSSEVDRFLSRVFSLQGCSSQSLFESVVDALNSFAIINHRQLNDRVESIARFYLEAASLNEKYGVIALVNIYDIFITIQSYDLIKSTLNDFLTNVYRFIDRGEFRNVSHYHAIPMFLKKMTEKLGSCLLESEVSMAFIFNSISSEDSSKRSNGYLVLGSIIHKKVDRNLIEKILPAVLSDMENPATGDECFYMLTRMAECSLDRMNLFIGDVLGKSHEIIRDETANVENAVWFISDLALHGAGYKTSDTMKVIYEYQLEFISMFFTKIDNFKETHKIFPNYYFSAIVNLIKLRNISNNVVLDIISHVYSRIMRIVNRTHTESQNVVAILENIASWYISVLTELYSNIPVFDKASFYELFQTCMRLDPSNIQSELFLLISRYFKHLEIDFLKNVLYLCSINLEGMTESTVTSMVIFMDAVITDTRFHHHAQIKSILQIYASILSNTTFCVETKGKIIESIGILALTIGKSFLNYIDMCISISEYICGIERDNNHEYCDFLRQKMLMMLSCIMVGVIKFPDTYSHEKFYRFLFVSISDDGYQAYLGEILRYIDDFSRVSPIGLLKDSRIVEFLSVVSKEYPADDDGIMATSILSKILDK